MLYKLPETITLFGRKKWEFTVFVQFSKFLFLFVCLFVCFVFCFVLFCVVLFCFFVLLCFVFLLCFVLFCFVFRNMHVPILLLSACKTQTFQT